jgi:hypothetical protein
MFKSGFPTANSTVKLNKVRFRVFTAALIALMMETVRTSEKSVNFYQTTRRNIPEDSHLKA